MDLQLIPVLLSLCYNTFKNFYGQSQRSWHNDRYVMVLGLISKKKKNKGNA